MRWNRILSLIAGSILLTLVLSACSANVSEDLYALPKQSETYYDLQYAIDQIMTPGASYAGPLTGSDQQSVQLVDLDGDTDDEAVVFLKTMGELPLKAYVFDRTENSYTNIAVIEGEGSGFDTVEYVQLDGEPGYEILLGRRLSDQILRSLTAYSCQNGKMTELMTCTYSEFKVVDLDADERKDVFVLRLEAEERAGIAELYRWHNDRMERDQEASMSVGAKQIKRIISGCLEGGAPAVFVASAYEEDTIITDIFAVRDDALRNIATGGELGVSAQTVRSYNVYATDIDADGVIELPLPLALPSYEVGEETQWIIEWYSLTIDGRAKIKMTTYHNYPAGWYLTLPEHWRDQITVSRQTLQEGISAVKVSQWRGYDEDPVEIVTIYAITGEKRAVLASAEDRSLLAEKGEVAYAVSLGTSQWAAELTQEELNAMFHFIYMDWNSGET